ncbi:MAG: hypothetical protein L6R39_000027 [Caloplaca ligustica]|nr:MAG: hypothetical protein L6R39_000027 [Caloplaca ligustica]
MGKNKKDKEWESKSVPDDVGIGRSSDNKINKQKYNKSKSVPGNIEASGASNQTHGSPSSQNKGKAKMNFEDDAPPQSNAPEATLSAHKKYYAEHGVENLVHRWFMHPTKNTEEKINRVNNAVKDISIANNVDALRGQIPLPTYKGHMKNAEGIAEALEKNPDDPEQWQRWSDLRTNIGYANQNKGLPETWNIPINYLPEKYGVEDKILFPGDDEPMQEPEDENEVEQQTDNSGD